MSDTELDFIVDRACNNAFPLLDELDRTNEMEDIDLINALKDDFGYPDNLAERVFDAWQLKKETKIIKVLKKPHPAHRGRMKILETFIKEVL